jgi:hypothetical protein
MLGQAVTSSGYPNGVPLQQAFSEVYVNVSHAALAENEEIPDVRNMYKCLMRRLPLRSDTDYEDIGVVIPVHMEPTTTSLIDLRFKNARNP